MRFGVGSVVLFFCVASSGCAAEPGQLRFGAMLARTSLLLVAVCALAVVTIRLAARYGVGVRRGAENARMAVLEELSIGPRESVVAIRAGERVVIAGRSSGRISALADMPLHEWEAGSRRAFSDVLEAIPPDDAPDFPTTDATPPPNGRQPGGPGSDGAGDELIA